jgi:anti-sigma28 factor (negative regulator of flagellin synthesis)
MAPRKGGNSASNVMKLDDAREKRKQRQDSLTGTGISQDQHDTEPAHTAKSKNNRARTRPQGAKTGNRSFDREKVERIKGEIARGEYKIDYFEVADKYIEHERFS